MRPERAFDRISMIPILPSPLIMMNRPPRNSMVDQSISLRMLEGSLLWTIIIRNPPARATKEGVRSKLS